MNRRCIALTLTIGLALQAASIADANAHGPGRQGHRQIMELDRHGYWGGSGAALGVHVTDITPALREHFGAPSNAGVLVARVSDESAAAKAGVKVGDVIVSVQGESIDTSGDLIRAIASHKPGAKIRVDVIRRARRNSFSVKLHKRKGGSFGAGLPFQRGGFKDFHSETPKIPELPRDLGDRLKELEDRLEELEQKL